VSFALATPLSVQFMRIAYLGTLVPLRRARPAPDGVGAWRALSEGRSYDPRPSVANDAVIGTWILPV
jgi:hypothetical protein